MSTLLKILLFSLAASVYGYKGGYEYSVEKVFVNITSFDYRYFEVKDNVIKWKKEITPETPIKVLYFFAREKDHKRFDQIDSRMDFCSWLTGINSKLSRPIFNFNLEKALGVMGQTCPIKPANRSINREFFPRGMLTDRHIPCDTQNFFFDVFYDSEYSPLLTIWVQFVPHFTSPACE